MADKIVDTFWMVWNESTHRTSYRHQTLPGAKQEAQRLALLNPGVKFYVMEVCGAAIAKQPVEWIEADPVPF